MKIGWAVAAAMLAVSLSAQQDPRLARKAKLDSLTTNVGADNCSFTTVSFPTTINGSLTTSSCVNSVTNSRDAVYAISGTAGQKFHLDYVSTAYDVYLVAKGDPAQSNFDLCFDNSHTFLGSESRAKADCTFAMTGTYFIHAESLFGPGDSQPSTGPFTLTISGSASSCTSSDTTLCLANNRFSVSTSWRTSDGNSGQGHAVRLSNDTGYFWFFSSTNIEMVLKVLNGCPITGNYWVFAGGLTNVQVTMTVTDTQSGKVKTYNNPLGQPFQAIQDTSAFATCP